ncbi:hypothetical protein PIB30_020743 [Stylosanthes scabra]|uniref:Uncharacterized protein n=1 Tax=Stylosanthes scabra TaxID=79078 RepID=A0ABU6Z596_9FABA|nr:hypothetical protein [Stylosanthes scabra]
MGDQDPVQPATRSELETFSHSCKNCVEPAGWTGKLKNRTLAGSTRLKEKPVPTGLDQTNLKNLNSPIPPQSPSFTHPQCSLSPPEWLNLHTHRPRLPNLAAAAASSSVFARAAVFVCLCRVFVFARDVVRSRLCPSSPSHQPSSSLLFRESVTPIRLRWPWLSPRLHWCYLLNFIASACLYSCTSGWILSLFLFLFDTFFPMGSFLSPMVFHV